VGRERMNVRSGVFFGGGFEGQISHLPSSIHDLKVEIDVGRLTSMACAAFENRKDKKKTQNKEKKDP
jgi:hypothetical protein